MLPRICRSGADGIFDVVGHTCGAPVSGWPQMPQIPITSSSSGDIDKHREEDNGLSNCYRELGNLSHDKRSDGRKHFRPSLRLS